MEELDGLDCFTERLSWKSSKAHHLNSYARVGEVADDLLDAVELSAFLNPI